MPGVTGRIALRPYLRLTAAERAWGAAYRSAIAVQSSGLGARVRALNKEWFPDRFAEAAARLIGSHPIVQVGSPTDPPVPCTHDLRGKTTLRQLAAVLANCRMFVGLEGMPMHMARAVECPSVIVYGGRLRPDEIGYVCNENLYRATPCSPCWRESRCDFGRACLDAITAQDVVEAVGRMLERSRDGLAVESYIIDPGGPHARRAAPDPQGCPIGPAHGTP
jgi:ADP-heptose:LPS heptosyltransferase